MIFRELLITVWNGILLRVKDARLSEKELEEIGFMLRRVWFTAQAYRERKKKRSLGGWLALLKGTAEEAGISL